MNSSDVIIIDDFLDNVDEIREEALLLEYTKSLPESNGWKGYRCLHSNTLTIELHKKIEDTSTHSMDCCAPFASSLPSSLLSLRLSKCPPFPSLYTALVALHPSSF
jgi:hypothetical protein